MKKFFSWVFNALVILGLCIAVHDLWLDKSTGPDKFCLTITALYFGVTCLSDAIKSKF